MARALSRGVIVMADSRCFLAATALGTCLALLPLRSSAATCDAVSLGKVANAVAAPLAQVRAAVARNTEMNPELEPAVADAIVVLKQRLARLVDAQMACLDAAAPAAAQLDAALARAAQEFAVRHSPPRPADSRDGDEAPMRFTSTTLHDGALLGVVTDIDIPCGSDAQWQLFAKNHDGWSEALRWTAPRYDRVDGAWWSFQGVVSPRDGDGRWTAAATHVRPWCSSTWSSIDYAVLRPGKRAERPQILLSGNDSLWWGGEDMGRLSLDQRHFELRFHAASIDPGVHSREFIRRFDLTATPPRRIPPLADSARDFVDEWLVSPWSQAQQWTVPSAAMDMQRLHEQWQQRRKQGLLEFAPTRRCSDRSVDVAVMHDGDSTGYFRVGGGSNYRLYAVRDEPDANCKEEVESP